MAVMPNTSPILAMLDPMALPTANSGLPSSAANTATRISGAEVPIETTVNPMSILETPRFVANAAAPDKNRSALHTSAIKPSTSSKSGSQIISGSLLELCFESYLRTRSRFLRSVRPMPTFIALGAYYAESSAQSCSAEGSHPTLVGLRARSNFVKLIDLWSVQHCSEDLQCFRDYSGSVM